MENSSLEKKLIKAVKKKWVESGDEVLGLCRQGANVNCKKNGLTPLMYASRNGHIEKVKSLLEFNADVNTIGIIKDIKVKAINRSSDFGIIEDKKETNTTALNVAVRSGHYHIVERILQASANLRLSGVLSPIYLAILHGRNDIVALLENYESIMNQ